MVIRSPNTYVVPFSCLYLIEVSLIEVSRPDRSTSRGEENVDLAFGVLFRQNGLPFPALKTNQTYFGRQVDARRLLFFWPPSQLYRFIFPSFRASIISLLAHVSTISIRRRLRLGGINILRSSYERSHTGYNTLYIIV